MDTLDLPDDLISVGKAARKIGAHVSTVHRWVEDGKIRGWRRRPLGADRTMIVISLAELLAFANPQRVTPRKRIQVETIGEAKARLQRVDAALDKMGL